MVVAEPIKRVEIILKKSYSRIYMYVFMYSIISMWISVHILIPHIFGVQNGRIPGDPTYYHDLALNQAKIIVNNGLGAFELRPSGQGVAGISSLYYLASQNSYITIFVNSILHGLSSLLMIYILKQWFSRGVALIAALPLIISPYMMPWFSQVNKDSYVLLGALLFIYGWSPVSSIKGLCNWLIRIFSISIGMVLVWLMRPYLLPIFTFSASLIFLPYFLLLLFGVLMVLITNASRSVCVPAVSGNQLRKVAAIVILAIVTTITAVSLPVNGDASSDTIYLLSGEGTQKFITGVPTISNKCFSTIASKYVVNVDFVPIWISQKVRAIIAQRCLNFTLLESSENKTTLNSIVDADVMPGNFFEALRYLPRAAAIGVLSPFPESFGGVFNEDISIFYIIAPLEATLLYFGLLSICIWIWRAKEWSIIFPVGISVSIMTIYGMATPFIGALYRYRYPWWMLLICIGLAALIDLTMNNNLRRVKNSILVTE